MKKNEAFTLIEVMVVTAVISLVASIAGAQLSESRVKAQDTNKIQETRQVGLGVEIDKASSRGSLSGGTATANTAYVEGSSVYGTAMNNLVSSGSIPEVPSSPNGQDYFYIEEADGDGVFGTVLNHDDAIAENGGCAFTNDDYSCDTSGSSGATYIYYRDVIVTVASDSSCVNLGVCDPVASGDDGSDPYFVDAGDNPEYITLSLGETYTVNFAGNGSEINVSTNDHSGNNQSWWSDGYGIAHMLGISGFTCDEDQTGYYCWDSQNRVIQMWSSGQTAYVSYSQ